ncbi:hypothetical protein GUITHDRAFT_111089 [Guillardia theta CCMP2712]|uniref:Uncharacterized protein n=1 Tax=Guillardia theta (strain CCMP2712) TaxID=905079 RepID=L1J3F4_GUITC|nr:hypothetical protein GUITHDRAFT_111089 [Guillardia theta CCMP2712]EKX43046.1 hypothetical protein GUITHDRAFT_111089 [Guillardia theta CCMP2712]|eukprot:XP_005830026.1 hypothetical protein GUITHDRAFT_111089 [Guillardia theta CCMP2712]
MLRAAKKQRLLKAEEELAVINATPGRKQAEASDPSTCLKDMVFMLHSTKNYRIDFDEWSPLVRTMTRPAGSIVKSMTKSVTHVLTTSGAHTAGGSAIKEAVKRKLPVVKLEFVEACISSGKRLTEQPYLLSGEATEDPEKKKKSSQSKTVKIMVKGKGAVDVESGLADDSHILEVRDNIYSATLNRTDISEGLNSYYVLQIIESDDSKTTHLFRKWGRIGVESKGTKLEKMPKDSCIHEFEKLFQEKTGNPWRDRTPDRFTQQPGRFAIMEIGIAAADEHGSQLQKDTSSKLPPTVASLIQLIFDIDNDDTPLIQQKANVKEEAGKKKKRAKEEDAVEDDDVPLSKMKKEKAAPRETVKKENTASSELDKNVKAIKAHSDKLFAIRNALKDVSRNLLKERNP